jgi:hypothetical protein
MSNAMFRRRSVIALVSRSSHLGESAERKIQQLFKINDQVIKKMNKEGVTFGVDVKADVAGVGQDLARNEVDGLLLLLEHDTDGRGRLGSLGEREGVEHVVPERHLVDAPSRRRSLPQPLYV